MSISILNNAAAQFAAREADKISDVVQNKIEILATGSVLADTANDPANAAIANRAKAEFAGLEQLLKNASSARTMLDTMEAYLSDISEMLIRASALSQQAASSNYSDADRAMMNQEYQLILTEIDRVSDTANYNGKLLFNHEKTAGLAVAAANSSIGNNIEAIKFSGDVVNDMYQMEYDQGSQMLTLTALNAGVSESVKVEQTLGAVTADFEKLKASVEMQDTVNMASITAPAADVAVLADANSHIASASLVEVQGDLAGITANAPVINIAAGGMVPSMDEATLSITTIDGKGNFEAQNVDLNNVFNGNITLSRELATGEEQSITINLATIANLDDGDQLQLNAFNNAAFAGKVVEDQSFTFRIGTGITGSNLENRVGVTVETANTQVFGIRGTDLLDIESAENVINTIRDSINKLAEATATVGASKGELDNVVTVIKTSLDNIAKAIDTVAAADVIDVINDLSLNETQMKAAGAAFDKAKRIINDLVQDALRKM